MIEFKPFKNSIFDIERSAKLMKKLSFFLLSIWMLVSCDATKRVAKDKYLLVENAIYLDSVNYKKGDLQKYILQKPNTKLLGLPLGLYFYNLGDPKKPTEPSIWGKENPRSYSLVKKIFSEKQSIVYANTFIKLNKWFLDFQEPVVLSERKVKNTKDNLWAYYKTQGFFDSKVDTEIKKGKHKKASVIYHISKGKPTILDTIHLKIESPVLDSIYKSENLNIALKTGDQYKDQTFRKEAKKVVKLFRNNGIYNFNEAAIGFYVDTTRADYKTNVDYIISKDRLVETKGVYETKEFKIHKIKNINVTTDYSFTRKNNSKLKDSVIYNGINFKAYDKLKYNPKYLSQSIFFKPDGIYKDTLRNLTRNHLKSLKNFKSTNITFTPVSGSDDELDMNISLTPIEKYTLGLETELTHSNIRELGTSAKFSISNRNTFKGAELLKLSFLGSYFTATTGPGWEIGADASLEIPRFVVPFGLGNLVPKRMSPRTLFSIGSSFQKNIGLDRQTFTILSDYQWQFDRKKTIQLEIFNTQYIQNLNVNRYFDIYNSEFITLNTISGRYDALNGTNFSPITTDLSDQASESLRFINAVSNNSNFRATNPDDYNDVLNIFDRYKIITSDFLIPTLAYTFTYNNQTNVSDNNFTFFKARIANSGNILSLLSNTKNEDGKTTFLNIPLAQYFKLDLEYKQFWDIGINSVFGFRTFLGTIYTYDNADIPFTKSYFAGGSNDIRAWQTYELGPGSTNTGLEFNVGSFKFLTSAEYRFDVYSRLKGALFIDAGNIWDITGGEFVDAAASFNGVSSLKDIAVGSGFGARLDFDFLIIRLDVGFKTYEPYLEGNKWFQNYDFDNSVFNIGINYPF